MMHMQAVYPVASPATTAAILESRHGGDLDVQLDDRDDDFDE